VDEIEFRFPRRSGALGTGVDFSGIDGIVSDMDGVLWRGDSALPGLAELFAFARERALPVALATNNSAKSQREYVGKLERLGVAGVRESQIVTSRVATVDYLRRHHPAGSTVYVIGSPGLSEMIAAAGFVVATAAEIVVVGLDTALTYDKLARAALCIRAGASFIGTNGDVALPGEGGLLPGAGSILAALEAATGVAPTIIGKPQPAMFEAALHVLGTVAERTLMLGDRLATDIAGARRAGLKAALLLTGVTTAADIAASGFTPDATYPDLPALLADWRRSV